MKGIINKYSAEYEVECALCENRLLVHRYRIKTASKDFRSEGWSKTKRNGWVCPKCVVLTKK